MKYAHGKFEAVWVLVIGWVASWIIPAVVWHMTGWSNDIRTTGVEICLAVSFARWLAGLPPLFWLRIFLMAVIFAVIIMAQWGDYA